jgi:hypothetical protein
MNHKQVWFSFLLESTSDPEELIFRVATGGVGEVIPFVDVVQASAIGSGDWIDISSHLSEDAMVVTVST